MPLCYRITRNASGDYSVDLFNDAGGGGFENSPAGKLAAWLAIRDMLAVEERKLHLQWERSRERLAGAAEQVNIALKAMKKKRKRK